MTNRAPAATNQIVEHLVEGGPSSVVVVDFADFSTHGTLAELISRDVADHTVLRIDAVTSCGIGLREMRIDELARACAAELRNENPALVIGYCSAASLALRIAAALGDQGLSPAVALVQPTWLTPDHIRGELELLRTSLHATHDYHGRLDAASITAVLRADVIRELTAEGMPDDEIEMCADLLLARYEAWFGFLLMTLVDEHGPADRHYRGPVEVFVGQESPPPPPVPYPETFAVRSLPVATAEFLQSEVVSTAIRAVFADSNG
jgi:hypothetical protein